MVNFRKIDESTTAHFFLDKKVRLNGMEERSVLKNQHGTLYLRNCTEPNSDIKEFVWTGNPNMVVDGDILEWFIETTSSLVTRIYKEQPEFAYIEPFGDRTILAFTSIGEQLVATQRIALPDSLLDFRGILCDMCNEAIMKVARRGRPKPEGSPQGVAIASEAAAYTPR